MKILRSFHPFHSERSSQVSRPLARLAVFLCALSLPAVAGTRAAEIERPRMEVVFVLDTTGSMGGLIAGAQEKIWAIANKLKSATPTPEIHFGLVAYRDRGDDYVTRVHELDTDIDRVHQQLFGFHANGGGDGPESVNEALHVALTQMEWSADAEVLRLVFLVGDAPPHMDYSDDVPYRRSCELAVEKDITINTLQCGSMGGTEAVWTEIANRTNGVYARIAQDGNAQRIATPHDELIMSLNLQLDATIIPYGDRSAQSNAAGNRARLQALSREAVAERSSFLTKTSDHAIMTGGGDLVGLILAGEIELDAIDPELLDASLRELTPTERRAYIEKQVATRQSLQADLRGVVRQRDAEVARKLRELSAANDDVIELNAFEVIEEQAARKGYRY